MILHFWIALLPLFGYSVLSLFTIGEGAGGVEDNVVGEVSPPSGPPLHLHPVILVPGDGGSQIEARLNKTISGHFWCSTTSDWYDLWLNIEQMLTILVSCWVDNVKLTYNTTTHTTSNAEGVETRVPGFGNTTSVEWIDKSARAFSVYFAKVVSDLLPMGYSRGNNIHGAPYDFRRAANEHDEYFIKVKELVEETYGNNGDTPVVLLCHSMGSIMMHYFLQQQSLEWKDKHIRALVTVAGVWGGTARALKVFSVGDNLDSWFLNERNLLWQRTSPSLAWLMPQEGFWEDDEVLIETEKQNFTRKTLPDYFDAYNEPIMPSMISDTSGLLGGLPAPQVEVFCTHGSKVDTTERLVYPPGSFPPPASDRGSNLKGTAGVAFWPWPTDPTLVKGDGDGTVNIRSLEGCLRWRTGQKQPVHHKVFPNVNHINMLRTDEPSAYIASVLEGLNKELHAQRADKERMLMKLEWEKVSNELKRNTKEDSVNRSNLIPEVYPIIEVIKSG